MHRLFAQWYGRARRAIVESDKKRVGREQKPSFDLNDDKDGLS